MAALLRGTVGRHLSTVSWRSATVKLSLLPSLNSAWLTTKEWRQREGEQSGALGGCVQEDPARGPGRELGQALPSEAGCPPFSARGHFLVALPRERLISSTQSLSTSLSSSNLKNRSLKCQIHF